MSPARGGATGVAAALGATALLLVLVTWAASVGPGQVVSGDRVEQVAPSEATQDPSTDPNPDSVPGGHRHQAAGPPAWLAAVAFLFEVATVGAVVLLLSRLLRRLPDRWRGRTRRRRRRGQAEIEFEVLGPAARVAEVMGQDAEEQRTRLAVEGEPRNAIVACWHRFEQQAVRGGAQRASWQTTAEFVLEVLDLVAADRGAVARLADLYREARFSDHPMTDDHRRLALASLDEIHVSLRLEAGAR